VRFQLDCTSDSEGRLEGTLAWEGRGSVPFSGTLELLRLLEDHTGRRGPGDDEAAPEGSEDQ
jgi:hypothetical protein